MNALARKNRGAPGAGGPIYFIFGSDTGNPALAFSSVRSFCMVCRSLSSTEVSSKFWNRLMLLFTACGTSSMDNSIIGGNRSGFRGPRCLQMFYHHSSLRFPTAVCIEKLTRHLSRFELAQPTRPCKDAAVQSTAASLSPRQRLGAAAQHETQQRVRCVHGSEQGREENHERPHGDVKCRAQSAKKND